MEFIVTDNAPTARASPGVGGLNEKVAIYGGENNSGPLADGGIFDINANGWVTMTGVDAPSARIKPSVIFIDEQRVLVWGGYTRTSQGFELPLNDGALYNIRTHRWTKISSQNAPSARMHHTGIWTGQEFFVMGGVLPGDIDQYSMAKYNPNTNSWQPLPNIAIPLSYANAVYHENKILIFGRNNSIAIYDTLTGSLAYNAWVNGIPKWNINPTLVLAQHPTGGNRKLLYIFGGGSSLIKSDVNEYVFTIAYENGAFDFQDSRTKFYANMFPSGTLSGTAIAKCCFDFLGFEFENKVFAINGTEVSNTTIFTNTKTYGSPDGSTNNYTSTFYTSKSYNSRVIFYPENDSNLTARLIDIPESRSTSGLSPLGPYHLHRTSPPVLDAEGKNLFFNGGVYNDPFNPVHQQGGYIYNLENRAWRKLSPATTELTYSDSTYGSLTMSRFESINFFIGNIFYILGGYIEDPTLSNARFFKFNGIKAATSNGAHEPFQSILSGGSDFDFNPISNSGSASRWDANPPCFAGNHLLLSGGLRKTLHGGRAIGSPALISEKVVFDSATDSLRRASPDTLGPRAGMTVVSTGQNCFLWGGFRADEAKYLSNTADTLASIRENMSVRNDGAIYSPATDSWQPIATENAPSARAFMHGVWTGQDVLVWGGSSENFPSVSKKLEREMGVWRFSPSLNRWTALGNQPGEPPYNADERPVWTGRHMFFWKPIDAEFSFQFTPDENKWSRIPMPFGFNFRINAFWDHNVTWAGKKLFVMPYISEAPAIMALFVPPDP
jgi:hypothetical protein